MVITTQNINQKPGYKQTEVGMIPEDWEVKPLAEIASVSSGGTPDRLNPTYWGGDVPWVTSTQINFNLIDKANEFITRKGLESSAARVYNPGTLLMAMYGQGKTRGKVAVLVMSAAINQACAAINLSKGISSEYVFFNLSARYEEIRSLSNTGNQENLNATIIKNILLSLPKEEKEQRAIVDALSDVDALITSLDKLIAKKRNIKQATMQQLLTGKTRLPGSSGEWKVKKVEEIGDKFVNGGTPSTQKSEYWQGNIPWITGADVINQKISDIRRYITTEAVKNSSTNIVERGNLLLVTRTGVGKLAVASFDVAISQDITGIYVKKEQASIEYLFHFFNYSSETLKSLNQGTSIAGITRETLLSTKVYLPSLPEQQAIASILSDMDAEIVALEQKRDKTRALKQGMMQELLSGKTRLV